MPGSEAEKLIRLTRHVSEILSSPTDLQRALESTADMLSHVLEAEDCSIMLLDEGMGLLRMAASSNMDRAIWPTVKARVGEGYAGRVAASGQPLLVRNAKPNEELSEERRKRYQSRSFMCVPMRLKGLTLGVINVTNRRDNEPFNQEHLDTVAAVGNLVALAIENTKLLANTDVMSRRLRDVLEGIGDGVIAVNMQGEILHHNEIALHYFGVEGKQCAGRRLAEVLPAAVSPVFHELFARTIAERQHIHRELPWANRGAIDSHSLTLSSAPLYQDACGKLGGVVFAIHDMSGFRKEEELQRLDEARNSFLAIVSHELRTPLTSIKGATHLLAQRVRDRLEPENAHLFQIIEHNTDRLMRQIINILDVVNIQNQTASIAIRRASLTNVAHRCVQAAQDGARQKQIELTENYTLSPKPIQIDEDKVGRAIGHLLDNAIKFTPRGGRVAVIVGQETGEAYVAIRDSGTGIDPVLRERIFGKFEQGEGAMTRQSGGCGIGLFVARAFAELHGGRIETANLENGGCEFRVVLPIIDLKEAYDKAIGEPGAIPFAPEPPADRPPAAGVHSGDA